MYIKSVYLENFKQFKDTEIEFDQITSIVGKNGHGKSNLIKALRTVLYNENWPSDWIRYGQNSAKIRIVLSDGTEIQRGRTPESQYIKITEPGKESIQLTGKMDAQQYVEAATKLKKVVLDDATGPQVLNFIKSKDVTDILNSKSSTVLRKIANLIGVNEIEDAKTKLVKANRSLTVSLNSLSKNISLTKDRVETGIESLKILNTDFDNIKHLHDDWEKAKTKFNSLTKIHKKLQHTQTITKNDIVKLSYYLDCIKSNSNTYKEKKLQLDLCNKVGSYSKPSSIPSLSEINNIYKVYTDKRWVLNQALEIKESSKECAMIDNELMNKKKELDILYKNLEELKSKISICPTCGRENV